MGKLIIDTPVYYPAAWRCLGAEERDGIVRVRFVQCRADGSDANEPREMEQAYPVGLMSGMMPEWQPGRVFMMTLFPVDAADTEVQGEFNRMWQERV